jgi:hypothetical protein
MIVVVVLRQLPRSAHNALWLFFSAVPELLKYARETYQPRSPDTSTLLQQLFEGYRKEGLAMPYTMEDFRREYVKEHLKDLTPEERLEGLPAEDIERYLGHLRAKTPSEDTSSAEQNPGNPPCT